MQPLFRRFLQTSLGQIQLQDINQYNILPHQYLTPVVSNTSIGQLNLPIYKNHITNLFNTTNTSITSTLFLHQIQHIPQPLIVDFSNSKDISLFKNVHIAKGSRIDIESVSRQEGAYIYSKGTIRQTLENNLALSQPKSSFIGEFVLPDMDFENEYYLNYVEAGLYLCKERGCFAVFNMINNKRSEVVFENDNSKKIEQIYEKFYRVIEINQRYGANIVLFNPLILLSTKVQAYTIIKQHKNYLDIIKIRSKGITIGYDLARYQSNKDFISLLANQINTYQDSTILSTGALYKTDLVSFGGNGWKKSEVSDYLESKIFPQALQKVRRGNIIRLLFWKTQEIIVKPVEYWKCASCGKQFSQETKKFGKMNKQFCSTGCIRAYKF